MSHLHIRAGAPNQEVFDIAAPDLHGKIVNADRSQDADLLISGEKIQDIAPGLPDTAADRVIDATGMLILPGPVRVAVRVPAAVRARAGTPGPAGSWPPGRGA